MNDLNILIVAHNEIESVKTMIESIRMCADVENLSVTLADNFSSDGLRERAETQTDFTYVFMDEGELAAGRVINEVIGALQLRGDLLIVGGHYLFMPGCLSHMQETLYSDSRTGAVSGLSNGFFSHQASADINENIQNTVFGVENVSKRVIGFCADAILFQAELLQETGEFEEGGLNLYYTLKDYCFRAILKGWQLRVCNTAFFWKAGVFDHTIFYNKVGEAFLEEKWGMHYFNIAHNESLIGMRKRDREDEIWVLEIGCDCGANLVEIQNQFPGAHLYGCEINEKAALFASCFATVKTENIEEKKLAFGNTKFDYIIFGDVLEHLHNPLETIIYCRGLLKEDGCIVASIPNVMNITVIEELLKGNFTYRETGLLDKTHIHFFTYYEVIKMFQEGGYDVEDMGLTVNLISEQQKELIDQLLALRTGSERFMYEAFQYLACARMREFPVIHIPTGEKRM